MAKPQTNSVPQSALSLELPVQVAEASVPSGGPSRQALLYSNRMGSERMSTMHCVIQNTGVNNISLGILRYATAINCDGKGCASEQALSVSASSQVS